MWGGGYNPISDIIDFITIATTGNAQDFGDLTVARTRLGATSSPIRGIWAGGDTPTVTNIIDFVKIASTGNAVDFGDRTIAVDQVTGVSNGHGGL